MKTRINNTDGDLVEISSPEDLGRFGIIVHEGAGKVLAGGFGSLADKSCIAWEIREKPEGGFSARGGIVTVSSPEFHTDEPERIQELLASVMESLHSLENV